MRVNITRFAPAPTGFLHLGHVVNALYVWGAARQYDARVLLRIEDHDRQRRRQEFEEAIFEDLDWLGFHADEPAVRQSAREDIYRQALDTLNRHGLVYACACTRAEIAKVAGSFVRAADDELRYPGTCRDRGLADAPGLGLRVRLAETIEHFVDLRHGSQEQQPSAQCGDLLIRDRDGNWTYQFCAAVDDYRQGVTLVVRGLALVPRGTPGSAVGPRLSGAVALAAADHAECSRLRTLKLPEVTVMDAVAVPAATSGAIRAAHCRVNGVIEKEIRFSLLLPDEWNHKFIMGGGGRFVAGIDNQARASVNAGYATVGTDTGHQGAVTGASWALNDLERQLNFGHIAVHRVAEVSK